MKKLKYITTIVLFAAAFGLSSCDLVDPDSITDPNNPAQEAFLENASLTQLQSLVTGLESRHRAGTMGIINIYGSFGREFYPMFESDPRFIEQWLGLNPTADAGADGSFFGSGGTWNTPYNAIKQGNVIIDAVANSDAVSGAEANGFNGFAKTIQAYQYLIPLMAQFDGGDDHAGGIRLDVSDPLNPGPYVSYEASLDFILNLLDEALGDLSNAGNSFAFDLHDGFDGFDTPQTLSQLNRAIKARAAIYAEEWDVALTALEDAEPFFELATGEATMNKGAYHVFGNPPDNFNGLFFPRNAETSQILMVHPSMPADAEANDERADNKFFLRDNPIVLQGLSSQYQDNRFESNTDPFPFMRNEELILIYAEASAQRNQGLDLVNAVDAINLVRNTWGLGDFVSTNQSEVLDQILYERRYSLFGEFGHRWIDNRRYGQLNQLPDDGGQLWNNLARRTAEESWDDFAGN